MISIFIAMIIISCPIICSLGFSPCATKQLLYPCHRRHRRYCLFPQKIILERNRRDPDIQLISTTDQGRWTFEKII